MVRVGTPPNSRWVDIKNRNGQPYTDPQWRPDNWQNGKRSHFEAWMEDRAHEKEMKPLRAEQERQAQLEMERRRRDQAAKQEGEERQYYAKGSSGGREHGWGHRHD